MHPARTRDAPTCYSWHGPYVRVISPVEKCEYVLACWWEPQVGTKDRWVAVSSRVQDDLGEGLGDACDTRAVQHYPCGTKQRRSVARSLASDRRPDTLPLIPLVPKLLKPTQRLSALQLAAIMDTSPAAVRPSGLTLAMLFP